MCCGETTERIGRTAGSRPVGFLSSLAPPSRNGCPRRPKVLDACVLIENPTTTRRCLVNHFAPNVGTLYPEVAVPKAQVTYFFFADERIVLLWASETRPHQSNDHRPHVDRCCFLVDAGCILKDLPQFRIH